MRLESWPLDRLKPYANNARTHSAEQTQQIAESIRAFGFNDPIGVAADGTIIEGHGRLEAAKLLALETVPVLVLPDMTPAQQRAYVIAHNRIAERAGWDMAKLDGELQALLDEGITAALLGFSDRQLKAALDVEATPPRWLVLIECKDEADQQALFMECQGRGLQCKITS